MFSAESMKVLREKHKKLLAQLEQQRLTLLEAVDGASENLKIERNDAEVKNNEAEEVIIVRDRHRKPAKAALAKSTVTFSDTIQHPSVQTSLMPCEMRPDDFGNSISKPPNVTSCLKGQRLLRSEENHGRDSHRPQPLLGYDWIAGVIDAEDSLMERSDDFFHDLCTFRTLHKDQCVNSSNTQFSEESDSSVPSRSEENCPTTLQDSHECTFSYRINGRLFAVPLNSNECCPVCKRPKADHPHTAKEPALIRVSIPRSTILPPLKYKAHRRCSFDPSDSLGLPSHCLSGWSNKVPGPVSAQTNLDLRSSVDTKKEAENKELENMPAFKASRQKPQQVPRASLLTRHNFQHFLTSQRK